MFDKMKALMDMKKRMGELKLELENTTFELESHDKVIKIVMNGSQEIKEVKLQGDVTALKASSLETAIKDTFNRALNRSQIIAADKMKSITGLNLPGMFS
jgi:DNA-binding protein YbaB